MIVDLEHLLSRGGARVVGARGYGKSHLVERLCAALSARGAAYLRLDAAALVGARSSDSAGDGEIEFACAQRAAQTPWWIVDNAEALLSSASVAGLARLSAHVESGALSVVLVRNAFVRESGGWFAAREAPLARSLPLEELTPLDAPSALALARSWLPATHAGELGAAWLADWSGGIPGLMRDLRTRVPVDPAPDAPPRSQSRPGAHLEIPALSDDYHARLLRALDEQALPPPALLDERTELAVGYLRAIGMIAPDYSTRRGPFIGKFWARIAREAMRGATARADARSHDVALRLEMALSSTGSVPPLCALLGVPPEDANLAMALHQVIEWHAAGDGRALTDCLAEVVGRADLRRALRSLGDATSQGDARDLARAVIAAAGGAP